MDDQFARCVWCDASVVAHPTYVKGLPYHWSCLKKRMVAIRRIAANVLRAGAIIRIVE